MKAKERKNAHKKAMDKSDSSSTVTNVINEELKKVQPVSLSSNMDSSDTVNQHSVLIGENKEVKKSTTISEDIDKVATYIKNQKAKENQKKSFFSIKRLLYKVKMHIAKVGEFAFLSETCGILGLIVSILIFSYTEKNNSRLNTIEKNSREKQINSILDKESFLKISVLKGLLNTYDENKSIYDSIIAIEENFYDLALFNNLAISDNPIPKDIFKNGNEELSIAYFNKISVIGEKSQNLINSTTNTFKSILHSNLYKNPVYSNLIKIHIANMPGRKKKIDAVQKKLNDQLEMITIKIKTKNISPIDAANRLNEFLKKENSFYDIINNIRIDVYFLDYIINQELLKQTSYSKQDSI